MFVKFTIDTVSDGVTIKSGEVRDLPVSSAQRWMRRGVAERCDPPTSTEKPPELKPAAAPGRRRNTPGMRTPVVRA